MNKNHRFWFLSMLLVCSMVLMVSGCGKVFTAGSGGGSEVPTTTMPPEHEIWTTGVTLNKTSTAMLVGGSELLVATVIPADASFKNVIWTTDNDTVATVDASGLVTGNAAGTARIIVYTSDTGLAATCECTVSNVPVAVTGITLEPTSVNMFVGGTQQLSWTISPANATDQTVAWSSDNETVATVVNGVVTGNAPGTANITATTNDGSKTATCNFTILPIPSGLTSTGSLGKIDLSWTAVSGVTGYNVYKSADGGVTYDKTSDSPVAANSYTDNIASPAGDGIVYYYKVTAIADSHESGFSNATKNLHGTRLKPLYDTGCTLINATLSPYVAEGKVVIDGGDLWVGGRTVKLYLTGNSTIDVEEGRFFYVYSSALLRSVATNTEPATLTSHKTGGSGVPDDGKGFYITLNQAVDYNPADGSGTLLQNMNINYLRQNESFFINDCSPKIYNCKVESNKATGGSYLLIQGAAAIENCSFNKIVPRLMGVDLHLTSFKMENNIFRGGYYSISFVGMNNPGVLADQIQNNNFDGRKHAYLANMTGGPYTVPVDNNYWYGGMPAVDRFNTPADIGYGFDPVLSAPPAGAGPDW